MEEVLVENAEVAVPDIFKVLPLKGYLRVRKSECVFLNFNYLIGLVHFTVSNHY